MARRALRLPDSGRLIGSAGRLEPVKGHALLIEALAALPTDVTLVLAGDGSQRPILEALAARLGVAERVHFLGHIDSIVTFYRALDVFCLPSVAEGLPLSVLEAQACGVAAVVVGGYRVQRRLGGGRRVLRNRSRDRSPNMSRANASSVPLRSDKEMPSPTTSPSSWENIGVCVRSRSSRR